MDDLWGNAWGSPEDAKDEKKPVVWSAPQKARTDDSQEDDLSVPSWASTGPGIRWDEPSATPSPLWSTSHRGASAQQDWSLDDNPYGDIPLGNSSQAELPNDDSSNDLEPDPAPPITQSDDIPASPPSVELEIEEEVVSPQPLSSVPTPRSSPPPSPNAFGTFVAGVEHSDVVPFSSERGSLGSQLYSNEWDSPWKSAPAVVEDESLQHAGDEWESAKTRQLEMDRRVVRVYSFACFSYSTVLTPASHQNYFRASFSIWRTSRRTLGQVFQMKLNQNGRGNGILA
jgi:hypothetical protein